MRNYELVEKAMDIAKNKKTRYLWGTFGTPLSKSLITQKAKQYPSRYSAQRQEFLKGKVQEKPWAFDCVGLIKGLLWGWNGTSQTAHGGAVYRSNGVPDINADSMAKQCLDRKTDMNHILPGEALFCAGHIGLYAGDGKVVEATLGGAYDGVVITDLSAGRWTGHGKLPWVTYEQAASPETKPLAVGDCVIFSGGKHYTSSTGDTGYKATPGPAKITAYKAGAKHPYHLIHTDRTSNVYGWVNEDAVSR